MEIDADSEKLAIFLASYQERIRIQTAKMNAFYTTLAYLPIRKIPRKIQNLISIAGVPTECKA